MTPNSQTRRAVLSSIASTSTLIIAPLLPKDAYAADPDGVLIPGVAAPFRNLIVEGATPWKPTSLVTNLGKSRILAKELSPLNPSLVPFASDNELYYDTFLFGAWQATATLKRKVFPYGTNYLPSPSLYEGSPRNRAEQPGDSTTYEMHYFSPNTDAGKIGSKSKIIADRAFNAKSLSSSYNQFSQVDEVQWDYKKDPTRLTIIFSTLAEDMRPVGKKRGEIYISARKTESAVDSNTGETVFCTSERLRSVVLVPGNAVASDTETITEFRLVNDSDGNHVKATSRIAVYLTPNPNSREGVMWQDVNGKAVAFFDYDIDLRRMVKEDSDGQKACVYSPSGAIQCA